ncbi:TetR/AcrR family transcriptional regulator [Halopseudomonas salegens]|uniref:Transcriptional regulator, TetR family n=1 Tax=Halopseudomonas salegens TaxID=1434072 RepID=A0A1H2FDB1_9GAMM|nr:TetR/AcrR family transcriptional regulator [Halopseudomonas salegens]SDU05357.1 transcriptional regulator, TetR family [Halopseudomonas salegens]
MSAAARHRQNIVLAAAKLFRQQGYASTGLKDILQESKAPKGSLYHYFPQGKEQLGQEALTYSANQALTTLELLAKEHTTSADLLLAFSARLASWMEASAFQDGCPMATTILETVPQSTLLRDAAVAGLQAWQAVFQRMLLAEGATPDSAARLSSLTIAVLEGALIQARVEMSARPLTDATEEVANWMRRASRAS